MLVQHAPNDGEEKVTFKDFLKAGKASLEHHWNNHEFCGSWCQAKEWTDKQKVEHKGTYRDKVSHPREYEQQLEVNDKFTSTVRMRRVFHRCGATTKQNKFTDSWSMCFFRKGPISVVPSVGEQERFWRLVLTRRDLSTTTSNITLTLVFS